MTHLLFGTSIPLEQQLTHQVTVFQTDTIGVDQQSDKPAVFDGFFRFLRPGEDREQRVLAFQAHMTAFHGQEGVQIVVGTEEHIKVALAGADQEALMKEFGKKKVGKANRGWNHVCRQI